MRKIESINDPGRVKRKKERRGKMDWNGRKERSGIKWIYCVTILKNLVPIRDTARSKLHFCIWLSDGAVNLPRRLGILEQLQSCARYFLDNMWARSLTHTITYTEARYGILCCQRLLWSLNEYYSKQFKFRFLGASAVLRRHTAACALMALVSITLITRGREMRLKVYVRVTKCLSIPDFVRGWYSEHRLPVE